MSTAVFTGILNGIHGVEHGWALECWGFFFGCVWGDMVCMYCADIYVVMVCRVWMGGGYVGTLVLNLLFLCAVSRHLPPPFLPNSISVSGSSASPHLAVGVQPGDLFAPNEQHHKLVLVYNWQTHELAKIYDGGKEGFFFVGCDLISNALYLIPTAGRGGLDVSIHTVFSPDGQ